MAVFRGEELIFRRERRCETGVVTVDPGDLGPGQLLVEARYTLVSQGTELANFTGLDPGVRQPGSWNCYPHRPGYAATGTVVATGPPAGGRDDRRPQGRVGGPGRPGCRGGTRAGRLLRRSAPAPERHGGPGRRGDRGAARRGRGGGAAGRRDRSGRGGKNPSERTDGRSRPGNRGDRLRCRTPHRAQPRPRRRRGGATGHSARPVRLRSGEPDERDPRRALRLERVTVPSRR